jgi:hypothetical protein
MVVVEQEEEGGKAQKGPELSVEEVKVGSRQ